jgi:hypothetical protein
MLTQLARGEADVVVAWALDRLQRNRPDELRLYEVCRERDAVISLIQGADLDFRTATGRMIADQLGTFARFEVELKSDRQRRAVLQAAKEGRRVGGRRPFGYEPDGMTVREAEAAAVRSGFDSLLAGTPLAQIARDWNTAGLSTPAPTIGVRDPDDPAGPRIGAGEPSAWTPNTVRGVLTNPRYAGLRGHGSLPKAGRRKITVMGTAVWPALVSEETWRAAVELLGDPARRTAPKSGRALLSGLALCGWTDPATEEPCGSTVHGGRNPQGQRTYRCRAATGHIVRKAEPVDEWVGHVIVARLSRDDAAELLVDTERPDAEEPRSRAMALRTRLGSLAELLADGTLSATEIRSASARLKAELAEVEAQMADAGRVDVLGPLVNAEDVAATWADLDTDRQRAVVATLARVVLLPPGRGTRTFRTATVVIEPRR